MKKIPSVNDICKMVEYDVNLIFKVCMQIIVSAAKDKGNIIEIVDDSGEKDFLTNFKDAKSRILIESLTRLVHGNSESRQDLVRKAANCYRGAHYLKLQLKDAEKEPKIEITDDDGDVIYKFRVSLDILLYAIAYDILYEVQPYEGQRKANWDEIKNYLYATIGKGAISDFYWLINTYADCREQYLKGIIDAFAEKEFFNKDEIFSIKFASLLKDAGLGKLAEQVESFCAGETSYITLKGCTFNFNDIHDNNNVKS